MSATAGYSARPEPVEGRAPQSSWFDKLTTSVSTAERGRHSSGLCSLCALAIAAVAFSAACGGGGSSSTQPSPTPAPAPSAPVNVLGAWAGTASDSSGPGQMTWQVTQSDTAVSGTVTMTDTSTGASGRGSLSGTMSGSALRFTISIAAGGFDFPYAACSASVTGDATASTSSISGSYSGTNSCSGAVSSGQISLSKQ